MENKKSNFFYVYITVTSNQCLTQINSVKIRVSLLGCLRLIGSDIIRVPHFGTCQRDLIVVPDKSQIQQ